MVSYFLCIRLILYRSSVKVTIISCRTCKNKDGFLFITQITYKLLSVTLIGTFWWIIYNLTKSKSMTAQCHLFSIYLATWSCDINGNFPLLRFFSTVIKSCHSYKIFKKNDRSVKKITYANKHIKVETIEFNSYFIKMIYFVLWNVKHWIFFSLKKPFRPHLSNTDIKQNGARPLKQNIRCF